MKTLLVQTACIGLLALSGCQSALRDSMAQFRPESDRISGSASSTNSSALASRLESSPAESAKPAKSPIELASWLDEGTNQKPGGRGPRRQSSTAQTGAIDEVLKEGH